MAFALSQGSVRGKEGRDKKVPISGLLRQWVLCLPGKTLFHPLKPNETKRAEKKEPAWVIRMQGKSRLIH